MTTDPTEYQSRISKVLDYIEKNLDGELSLELLATIAFFSPFHFHRIFTTHTGESIKSYIRRLRLARAKQELTSSNLSIQKIAKRAGYHSQQSFHRAFKEYFKKTPKALRDFKMGDEV